MENLQQWFFNTAHSLEIWIPYHAEVLFLIFSDLQKPGFDNSSRCSAGSSAVPTRAVGAIGHIGQQKNNMLLVICLLMYARPLDNSQIDTEIARKEASPFFGSK